MSERGSCNGCRFWANANGALGYCHRRAPVANDQATAVWPMTGSYSWCGEFEASTPQPNADEGDGK